MLWFRRSVPSDLISRLGKSDIRWSLRTSDFRIARRRASTLVRVVEEAFETLRSAGLVPEARSALAAILDHVMDDFDGDRRRWADRAKYQMLMESLSGADTSWPIVIGQTPALAMEQDPTGHKILETDRDEPSLVALNARISTSCVSSATSEHLANTFSLTSLEAIVHSAVAAAVSQSMARPGSRDLLSSRIPSFLEAKKDELGKTAKHLADYPGRIGVFMSIIGDKPIGDYGTEDMMRFRDVIDCVPVNAKKRFRTADLLDAIAQNKAMSIQVPPIDPVTVDAKYLSPIKTMFRYFVELNIIERNPLDGIASKRVKMEGIRLGDGEERLPLTNGHIEAIKRIADRKPKDSPDQWWISVLPWTGLRLDEFAQLSVFDIQTIHGRPCIDLLHTDVNDLAHRERRKVLDLKSEASRRVVPIHANLIAVGFLDFVERRRMKHGDMAPLFPECVADKFGCHSAALSKRLNRQIDKVTKDPRHVVHSARHTFGAACDAAGIPEALRDKFMGHMGEDDDTEEGNKQRHAARKLRRRYGSPIPSAEELTWIDRLKI